MFKSPDYRESATQGAVRKKCITGSDIILFKQMSTVIILSTTDKQAFFQHINNILLRRSFSQDLLFQFCHRISRLNI